MKIDTYELSSLSFADLIAMTQRWDIIKTELTEEAEKLLHTAVYNEIKRRTSMLFK